LYLWSYKNITIPKKTSKLIETDLEINKQDKLFFFVSPKSISPAIAIVSSKISTIQSKNDEKRFQLVIEAANQTDHDITIGPDDDSKPFAQLEFGLYKEKLNLNTFVVCFSKHQTNSN
jgi:dUTPase